MCQPVDNRIKNGPSLEALRKAYAYDPKSGVFTRARDYGRFKKGEIGGRVNDGRVEINVVDRRYLAHRLAWLYMTGEWPVDTIDHIDRNPLNNRWDNLRMVTQSEQGMNKGPLREGKLTGTYKLKKRTNLWRAYIKVNRKEYHLGYFKSEQAAHEAYLIAKSKLHVINTYEAGGENLSAASAVA